MTALPGPEDALFHFTTPREWGAAQVTGTIVPAGFADEGFVHCSTGAQLAGTIERHFGGHDELVLLRLVDDHVAPDLRWEESRPGQVYPHLHRPLLLSDVADATTWRRDSGS